MLHVLIKQKTILPQLVLNRMKSNMKTSVVICTFFAVCHVPSLVFGAAAKISDAEATNVCINELKLDESAMKSFESLNDASNADFNNLLSCSWKKMGLQGEDGKVNFPDLVVYLTEFCEKRAAEVFTAVPDRAAIEGWLESCRDLQGDNHGQIAAKVHFCLSRGIDKFKESHKKQQPK